MRHRRALELPLEERAAAPAPRQAPAPRSGDLLRPLARADAARAAPAELWLAVHLTSPSPPSQQDFERLAVRAQRLTPRVSLDPPDGLLLEVKGSLHLFGGVAGLSREMAAECSRLRMPGTLAVAPTPLAALALARAGRKAGVSGSLLIITDPAQLVGKLSPVPLAMLRWPQDTLGRLARIGVRTIGEALRLPRAGFARRFGTAQLQALDRLVGRASDLRDGFEVRARFRRRRELLYELESHAALLAVLTPLLEELGEFLEARQCGVLALECRLQHRNVAPTCCVLRLAAPLADAKQIGGLLGERLRTVVLPEAVRACELRSGVLVARVLGSGGLWRAGEHGGGVGEQAPDLIERLRVRLGDGAVYGLRVVDDHRAEAACATSTVQSGLQDDPGRNAVNPSMEARGSPSWRSASGQDHLATRSEVDNREGVDRCLRERRPLWLLKVPRLLRERDGLPRRRGELRLLGEAERIETGWWDGGGIARDYYTAIDRRGARLWVFREREAPHRWFLHGVFG